jgi:hypothetical protein
MPERAFQPGFGFDEMSIVPLQRPETSAAKRYQGTNKQSVENPSPPLAGARYQPVSSIWIPGPSVRPTTADGGAPGPRPTGDADPLGALEALAAEAGAQPADLVDPNRLQPAELERQGYHFSPQLGGWVRRIVPVHEDDATATPGVTGTRGDNCSEDS